MSISILKCQHLPFVCTSFSHIHHTHLSLPLSLSLLLALSLDLSLSHSRSLSLSLSLLLALSLSLSRSRSLSLSLSRSFRCVVKIIGEMVLSFPAGITRHFANNPCPAVLTFSITNYSRLEHVLPNPQLLCW